MRPQCAVRQIAKIEIADSAERGPLQLGPDFGFAIIGGHEEIRAGQVARRAQRQIQEADNARIDAGAVLDFERRGDAMRNRLLKFYVDPAASSEQPVPIGAVYALTEIRHPEEPGIERPNIVDATKLLTANAYRPMLIHRFAQRDVYFRGGTTIAATSGIFRLNRRLGFDDLPATIAMLREHWAHIGLAEAAS